jgi:hypothetical protein
MSSSKVPATRSPKFGLVSRGWREVTVDFRIFKSCLAASDSELESLNGKYMNDVPLRQRLNPYRSYADVSVPSSEATMKRR